MKAKLKSFIFWLLSPVCYKRKHDSAVYLTFDDGPHPENTPQILDILKKYNVHATFFMVGKWMEQYPNIVHRIIAEGHQIGYHAYRHQSLKKTDIGALRWDLNKLQSLENMFNRSIRLFRPPFGDLTVSGILGYWLSGRKIALWNKDSRDSFDNYEAVVSHLSVDQISAGDILLLHDDYQYTARLLDQVLADYKTAGITLARL